MTNYAVRINIDSAHKGEKETNTLKEMVNNKQFRFHDWKVLLTYLRLKDTAFNEYGNFLDL